jgi:hypothetical protein
MEVPAACASKLSEPPFQTMSQNPTSVPSSKARRFVLAALSLAIGLAVPLLLAEGALRFLPVATGLAAEPVDAAQPIFKFMPDRPFVYSRDWDFSLANRGRTNNDGWVNDRDYARGAGAPVVAVVGDSYVEALMVPFAATYAARLRNDLDGRLDVRTFAASGAPLSQYVVWAEYAVKRWGAQAVIVNVVGNDFDESLALYKQGPGFWHYAPAADGTLEPRLFEYRPGILRSVVHASALARYLVFNLQIQTLVERFKASFAAHAAAGGFAGNVPVASDPQRDALSLQAIDAALRDLSAKTGLAPDRIAFVVDGFRYPDAVNPSSYFGRMRAAFVERARAAGHTVFDLDDAFFAEFARHGRRFEFPNDGHWSAEGHRVVAETLGKSDLIARWRTELSSPK